MSDLLKQNWGNLASVLGLGVSVWVLVVAQKAREAAEEARGAARLKSLLEELELANNKSQLLGVFLIQRKWEIVQLLVDEALGACQSALARWGDHLTHSKNSLLDVCTVFRSISEACLSSTTRPVSEEEWQQTMRAQREARELISVVLGQVRKAEERSSPNA
jgi:hypothetical protein